MIHGRTSPDQALEITLSLPDLRRCPGKQPSNLYLSDLAGKIGAGEEIRTLDPNLGKVRLSDFHDLIAWDRDG